MDESLSSRIHLIFILLKIKVRHGASLRIASAKESLVRREAPAQRALRSHLFHHSIRGEEIIWDGSLQLPSRINGDILHLSVVNLANAPADIW